MKITSVTVDKMVLFEEIIIDHPEPLISYDEDGVYLSGALPSGRAVSVQINPETLQKICEALSYFNIKQEH